MQAIVALAPERVRRALCVADRDGPRLITHWGLMRARGPLSRPSWPGSTVCMRLSMRLELTAISRWQSHIARCAPHDPHWSHHDPRWSHQDRKYFLSPTAGAGIPYAFQHAIRPSVGRRAGNFLSVLYSRRAAPDYCPAIG